MVMIVVGDEKWFDDKLMSLIKSQDNEQAISMLINVAVHELVDGNRQTLLHHAALYDNAVVAQYLIERGCEVNASNRFGNTPFDIAVSDSTSGNTAKILLKANAKVGKFSDENFLLRPMLRRYPSDLEVIECIFAQVVGECIDNNETARKLAEHECPLAGLIFLKNPQVTRLMLDHYGCSANDCLADSGETALHLAVEFSDIGNANVLLDYGADINAEDSQGYMPLHCFSVSSGNPDILKLLLDRGAILSTQRNGRGREFIRRVLSEGDIRAIDLLIARVDLSRTYGNGFYPVHDLAGNRNEAIVDLLQGKDINYNVRDDDGFTALDRAVIRCCVRAVQFLLDNGADPNTTDDRGSTPLYYMVSETTKEIEPTRRIVELLLHYGADAKELCELQFPRPNDTTEDTFYFFQPVLAHVALLESLGEHLSDSVYEGIEAHHLYKNYFESCRLQIELMKSSIMYESVTMYSLLFEERENIAIFSRNQEFVSNYGLFVKDNENDVDVYYINTICFHVDKTLNLVQMKEKVAGTVCQLIDLPHSMIDTIGHEVVKYLRPEDWDNVLMSI